jgi:hypothetical protein
MVNKSEFVFIVCYKKTLQIGIKWKPTQFFVIQWGPLHILMGVNKVYDTLAHTWVPHMDLKHVDPFKHGEWPESPSNFAPSLVNQDLLQTLQL